MSKVKINLGEVKSANSKLSRYNVELSDIEKELKISKWKMNQEILAHRDLENRLSNLIKEISAAKEQMQNIHNVVSLAVMKYEDAEKILTKRAEKFLL